MKKKIFFFLFMFSFVLTNSVHSNEKIVFIDINYIFNNSDAGKKLQLEIKKKRSNLESKINQFKKEIALEKEKLLSQKNVLSEDEYNKQIAVIEKNIKQMNVNISKSKKEIDIFQNKIEREFSKILNAFIEEFSTNNSIDIILNKDNLLMAKKNLDITNEIFDLFNKNIKQIKLQN